MPRDIQNGSLSEENDQFKILKKYNGKIQDTLTRSPRGGDIAHELGNATHVDRLLTVLIHRIASAGHNAVNGMP